MSTIEPRDATERDHDVVIVGGGPAGCSVGVFTGRYGLDTVIFDRGRSSIARCAHLENYLGFPAGIDAETFYGLMHDHVEEAGCELVPQLVESVDHAHGGDDGGDGFVVETKEGRRVTAGRVVAATRYDGEYLRPLDDDAHDAHDDADDDAIEDAMFETYEFDGEEHERFDRSYPDVDGRTPVGGLYVASPSEEADRQVIVAAGRGARVGLALVTDVRRERGYPDPVADQYDWVRREAELHGEWSDRERWREWFDDRLPDGHDLKEERRVELREREIDRRLKEYLSAEEIEHRAERGPDRLLDHVDDDLIVERAREIEVERRRSRVTD